MLVATKPVDFRKGIDGLIALVKAHLRLDPFADTVFGFRAKRVDRVRLLVQDGNGLVMNYKRLDQGKFRRLRSDKVSKWLGHSSIKVTESNYAFLEIEHLHDTVGTISLKPSRLAREPVLILDYEDFDPEPENR